MLNIFCISFLILIFSIIAHANNTTEKASCSCILYAMNDTSPYIRVGGAEEHYYNPKAVCNSDDEEICKKACLDKVEEVTGFDLMKRPNYKPILTSYGQWLCEQSSIHAHKDDVDPKPVAVYASLSCNELPTDTGKRFNQKLWCRGALFVPEYIKFDWYLEKYPDLKNKTSY